MWYFRRLGRIVYLRRFIKWLFGLYFYDGRVIKIIFDPIKGFKWFCSNAHQFWMPLGLYEKETTEWLI